MMGWDDTVWNHITARTPGTDHTFFMHQFGLVYEEVKASNLIKVDENGNLFSSAWDGVQIFSPKGELLAKIQIPEQRTANLCFGGENFDYLFIASDKSLYKIKLQTKGNKVD